VVDMDEKIKYPIICFGNQKTDRAFIKKVSGKLKEYFKEKEKSPE
jgi:hypothetical protein